MKNLRTDIKTSKYVYMDYEQALETFENYNIDVFYETEYGTWSLVESYDDLVVDGRYRM